ncbi:hypothetical protein CY0110_17757 [Crocosphaera chwakensis CCY0110]|uniref:Uncharacterized protein n=1 Tax=Crocosphaera chwakensis CCY0110 TaxID=391612 RepID=A3IIN3_9CHRO|nr:hypothetical protein CY0110_17757 [Crocosphaera chwakensis CCY0110]
MTLSRNSYRIGIQSNRLSLINYRFLVTFKLFN